jgi:hypothetical protein
MTCSTPVTEQAVAELRRLHRSVLELLPAARVHQDAPRQTQLRPRALQRLHEVLPYHERKAEQQDASSGRTLEVAAQTLQIEAHVLPQRVERTVAKLGHTQDSRAPGGIVASVTYYARMIEDDHREALPPQEMLRHLDEHRRLHRGRLAIEDQRDWADRWCRSR